MEEKFNNYALSNSEIEKILEKFEPIIKSASRINGKIDEECEQRIKIVIFKKLSRNRSKNNKK